MPLEFSSLSGIFQEEGEWGSPTCYFHKAWGYREVPMLILEMSLVVSTTYLFGVVPKGPVPLATPPEISLLTNLKHIAIHGNSFVSLFLMC